MPATRIKTTDDLAEILRRRHQAAPSNPSLLNVVGRWRERRLTRALARTPIGDLFGICAACGGDNGQLRRPADTVVWRS